MFFNEGIVYKVYTTRKGAKAYVARNFATATNITIQEISNSFFVIGN